MLLKDILYPQLWWPFCLAELNHLCEFGRGHYEEHLCDITLNLACGSGDAILRYFYLEFWWPFCSPELNQVCNQIEGLMRNISVKLLKFGQMVQKEMRFKATSYLELWCLMFSSESK